ncbi:MAG: flagellar basal body P-ring formation protein FlgA [Opitutales bacterium]|nr:flagellar basal body P-ring formation protein FlgA [Opitutales bacterium]
MHIRTTSYMKPRAWSVGGRSLFLRVLTTCIVGFAGATALAGADEASPAPVSDSILKGVELGDLQGFKVRGSVAEDGTANGSAEAKTKPDKDGQFVLQGDEILTAIRESLEKRFDLSGDLRLFADKPIGDVRIDHPDWEVVLSAVPGQGIRSRFLLGCELRVQGQKAAEWHLNLRAELWRRVVVATRRIERQSALARDLVEWRDVDVLALGSSPLESMEAVSMYQLVRTAEAGKVILWKDIKDRPLVLRNSVVEVVAEEGRMRISMKGKALEEGVMGQVIRVRNMQTRNDFQAEVIGENQAKVHF